jgi:hypothetical protein
MLEEDQPVTRFAGWMVCVLLLPWASSAWAQAAKPDPPPPFQLTPDQQKSVDRALDRWQQWNSRVKTFDCRFKRWVYDGLFGQRDRQAGELLPKSIELGTIRYAAPDQMAFRLDMTEKSGKESPIDASRAEHWLLDGKSVFDYRARQMQVLEHKLPDGVRAGDLADGPLSFGFPFALLSRMIFSLRPGTPLPTRPFPFSADAKGLQQQYYIREITPTDQRNQIWLEAFPRSQHIAGVLCQKMVLVFNAGDMSPFALRIVQPNGKDYTVYQFYGVVVNDPASQTAAALQPTVPPGWRLVRDEPPPVGKRYGPE